VRALDPLGHPRVHLRVTDSTNERARALAAAGAPHGTLVTAGEQLAGRGRQGRRWSAPAGSSLLASLVLRSPPALLPLRAAVAVCDAVGDQAAGRGEPMVKWPNDVVVLRQDGFAKLAGILAEGRPQEGWAVLGIGLNVAVRLSELPAEVRGGAATLELAPAAIEPILTRLLQALAQRLKEPAQSMLDAYRRRDALRGRPIAWAGGRGRAEGIDGEGRLVVALDAHGRRTALEAGEVHLTP
jgi:BirA family transcriptional regulator, biotin operon repressor / biotin---[acetyl-CoA-carboxylase] ligase